MAFRQGENMKEESTEYIIAMCDGDTRFFESIEKARDFICENREQLRNKVEKRVWNHSKCTENNHGWCEIDEQKTKLISIKKFMSPRGVSP